MVHGRTYFVLLNRPERSCHQRIPSCARLKKAVQRRTMIVVLVRLLASVLSLAAYRGLLTGKTHELNIGRVRNVTVVTKFFFREQVCLLLVQLGSRL